MFKLIIIFFVSVTKYSQYGSQNGFVVEGKYVEGHLKTVDNWAFLARFCFLSGRGRYEYEIEYERRFGELQLLLYYDDKTQWPSVYKTGKTCQEKLSVLSVRDNQIVTLSPKAPYNIYSGCTLRSSKDATSTTTEIPIILNGKPIDIPATTKPADPMDPTYFDQFLKPTTVSPSETFEASENPTTVKIEVTESVTKDDDLVESFNKTEKTTITIGLDMGGFDNKLENASSFKNEVEELFGVNPEEKARLRRAASYPKLFDTERKGTLYVTCHNVGGFTSSRERWWYIAIANCNSNKGLDVKYKFRMTNGPPGDFWHEHFSADEMYIPPILFAEALSYSLLLVAIFLCGLELKSLHLYHCTYRLFTFSALSQWFGVLLEGVTWAKYALTGLGPHRVVGGIFMGASEISFLLLMLLMAKGYTITRARLSTCSTVKITVFINAYIVLFISLYIYQAEAFDPGEVLNLYESPAGFGLAGLRMGSWIAFVGSIASTIRKYPEKGAFYYPFGVLGSLWILAGPLLTLVGVGVLDAWVRESVVCGISGWIAFGGHLAFLWLTWPSRANKSFPYHVRTNHVGIAADDDGIDYPRHAYEPSSTEQNIIIPLSRRTEELLNGVYSQYLRERNCYNSTSHPISHVSFPHPPPTAPLQGQTSFETQDSPTHLPSAHLDNQIDSGHPSIEGSNTNSSPASTNSPRSNNSPTHTTASLTPKTINTTATGYQSNEPPDTPTPSTQTFNTSSPSKPNSANSKPNPFLASAGKGPNKVILQPIELPLRSGAIPLPPVVSNPSTALVPYNSTIASNNNNNNNNTNNNNALIVPRHLFTAKSPSTGATYTIGTPQTTTSSSQQSLLEK